MKTIKLNVSEYGFVNDGKGIDKAVDEIWTKYSLLQHENQILRKSNAELKSEHYKDEELQRLKLENDKLQKDLIRGFRITDEELEKINKWQQEHNCKYRNTRCCGISNYRFDIIPGIGYNAYVKCSCGEEYCFYKE